MNILKKIMLASLALSLTSASFASEAVGHYDLLIINGTLVDGTGAPAYQGDLAIKDGKIAALGDVKNSNADRVINAMGLHVVPGFVDLHNHADRNIRDNPGMENYLFQGVTTILTGNCGNSPVHLDEYFQSVEENGIALNMGLLIGHNAVRSEAMGNDNRAPSSEEQEQMEALVKAAMDDGAFGMSTGLIYLPGTYSQTDEVVKLARVVSSEGGFYASHIRNEFDEIIAAIEEGIFIGREAGLPAHLSHYKVADNTMWGESTITLGLVEAARATGQDVTVDLYPYTAGSTGLANVLPKWARAGSQEDVQGRLDDPETRARIKTETMDILNGARAAGDLSRITIASFPNYPEYAGKTMAEVVRMNGLEPSIENGAEVAMKILYDGKGSAIYHMMVEEDVRRIMQAEFASIASDGSGVPFGKNVPHLRNYGTFPRVLARYVRDDNVLELELAIHKMSAMPAQRMGMTDRGTLAVGKVADISIFDLETVRDNDDWANPHQYAEGFRYVIVNGEPVIDQGGRMTNFPGRILKRTGASSEGALTSP